jgi:hypothetical protein
LRRPRRAASLGAYALEELGGARNPTRLFDGEFAPGDGIVPERFCSFAIAAFPRNAAAARQGEREKAGGIGVFCRLLDDWLEQSLRGSTIGLSLVERVRRGQRGQRGPAPAQNLGVLHAIETDLGVVLPERRQQALGQAEGLAGSSRRRISIRRSSSSARSGRVVQI